MTSATVSSAAAAGQNIASKKQPSPAAAPDSPKGARHTAGTLVQLVQDRLAVGGWQSRLMIVTAAVRQTVIDLSAGSDKLFSFFAHAGGKCFTFLDALVGRVLADVLSDLHRTEMRAAH